MPIRVEDLEFDSEEIIASYSKAAQLSDGTELLSCDIDVYSDGELVGNVTEAQDWDFDVDEFRMNFSIGEDFKFDILIQSDGDVYAISKDESNLITLDIKALNLKL